jgi:hypothetical protein
MATRKATIQMVVTYDDEKTDPVSIATGFDRMWKTVHEITGPDTWEDYGTLTFGEFLVGEPEIDGKLKVLHYNSRGQLDHEKIKDIDDVHDQCADLLNDCNSWDIIGSPVFKCDNGEWYSIVTETLVHRILPEHYENHDIQDSGLADDEDELCPKCGSVLFVDECPKCDKGEDNG